MIICWDLINHEVSETESKTDESLFSGNAFTGGPEDKGTGSMLIAVVDIVMKYHLQETRITTESYEKHIKDYIKSIKGKLEEQRPRKS
ncbi:translationally-controlled tumor protein-like [Herpailurus yagouaroundi]|uniref:translationally-controlled tumor protein-like n=1 Tax=Herpailurus yagouaroundi TaxID=1608482 RepID=UPI001AD74DDC|nr:translationally-controlled tumor protein-like [Puma yagouaroundi]